MFYIFKLVLLIYILNLRFLPDEDDFVFHGHGIVIILFIFIQIFNVNETNGDLPLELLYAILGLRYFTSERNLKLRVVASFRVFL